MLYTVLNQYYKITVKKIVDKYDNYLRQRNVSESQENFFDLESNNEIQDINEDFIKSDINNSDAEM